LAKASTFHRMSKLTCPALIPIGRGFSLVSTVGIPEKFTLVLPSTSTSSIAKAMLPQSNETFVPLSEPSIFIYVSPGLSLALRTGARAFIKQTRHPERNRLAHMVRIGSRNWTPAEITRLIALIDGGSSAQVIAVSLKRSITAIRAKARALGKPFPIVASKKRPSLPNRN
jgi:hypothetical protein